MSRAVNNVAAHARKKRILSRAKGFLCAAISAG